jgi:hypothetical protein
MRAGDFESDPESGLLVPRRRGVLHARPQFMFGPAFFGGGAVVSKTWRYWRLYITASSYPAGGVGLEEFHVSATVGGATLTSPSTPVTASSYFASYFPAGVVDNTLSGFASQWLATAALPQWIYIDLGSAQAVAQVSLWGESSTTSASPADFMIQGSPDTAAWTTIRTVTGETWTTNQRKDYTL